MHIPKGTADADAGRRGRTRKGARDLVLPYAQSAAARERLPQARHVALPHCGHVPMIDDPDLVVRIIEQTVAAAETARAA